MDPARPARQQPLAPLTDVALRALPSALIQSDLLPVNPAFAELIGGAGLRRGTTVVVHGGDVPGATSLLLGLLAGPSLDGAWCAIVGAPELGILAASELGVALDHLLLVPEPGRRLAQVAAVLLEACDVVCLRLSAPLATTESRRLAAKARERRAVLVVATGGAASLAVPRGLASTWSEMPDLRLAVLASRFTGTGNGSGRVEAHLLEVVARRRRAAPEELARWLWMPGPDGRVAIAVAEDMAPGAASDVAVARRSGTR